jgi:hypothetical protein
VTGREPSPLAGAVHDALLERFGEPQHTFRFEAPGDPASAVPEVVDVFAWTASPTVEITNFATAGMSERPMNGVPHRAELHFAVRAALSEEDLERAATTLANLAALPFLTGRGLDWWHTLVRFGTLPGFPSCSAVLLHPAFTHGGWDRIEAGTTTVKILNVVPITEDEMATARDHGVGSLMERVYRDDIDLLCDRV